MGHKRPIVLHVRVVCGPGGGPEKTLLNSPRFLSPHGYDTLCAYMHPPGDPAFEGLEQRAAELGAPLVGVEDRGPLDPRVLWRLFRLCRDRRVDLWHGHDYKSNALGLLLSPFWPMKLVSTVHGWVDYSGRTPLYYKIDRLCLRWYERVLCVSEDLRRACLAGGVRADRCLVVQNAIDTPQYARRRPAREAKTRAGFDPDRPLIGSVGRLSAEKNFAGLIRAVDRLLRDGLDVGLVILGEGKQRPALESLIGQLGRGDRIHLLGHRTNTLDLYEAMDVFALASLREGLPNVLLEAMAMEVPPVATRVAGVPGVVQHDGNGLLVEPGDENGLAAALERLLRGGDLRNRLARSARCTVERDFSFEKRMQKVRSVYEDLLGPVTPATTSPPTEDEDRDRGD